MNNRFIHLKVQSSYSLLESCIKINQIVDLAKKFHMPAVGLSDRNNLFGCLEFSMAAFKAGVQPINGMLTNLAYEKDKKVEFGEIIVIAQTDAGLQNLLKLASYPYIKNDRKIKEHITFEDLLECKDGLIIISCYQNGAIAKHISNDLAFAQKMAKDLKEQFQDNFYFEITRHGVASEKSQEFEYLNLADGLGIPVVATNNVLFNDVMMHDVHDVLLCIAQSAKKYSTNRITSNNQNYFKSQDEMHKLFADLPETIDNSWYIAQRCSSTFTSSDPILPKFTNTEDEALKEKAYEGLDKKLKIKFAAEGIASDVQRLFREEYYARLDYELKVICEMRFAGYFLIVSDFILWSKQNGIAVGPGRGSGAGSIVAWSLQITDLDPIRFGLIFERFLNPERISMPDFDIDFCQERRDEVMNYVSDKYGRERVAHIITFGSMQAKGVIKDVSRALDLRYKYADYLTELVPFNAVNPVTLSQAIKEVGELQNIYQGKGLYNPEAIEAPTEGDELEDFNKQIKEVLNIALQLEGVHRHVSTHAAGVVIAGQDLIELVPLYSDKNSKLLIVQYSMKYAELAGLVKFDFLGLQTLTVISDCLKLLKGEGIEINIDTIPLDDTKVYQMLSKGSTVGVFQFESAGMKDSIKKLKPDRIEDLMALSALYRPGPMDNIPTYIACKHGKQQPNYLHPLLETVLKDTYGVIIYQEQVLEVAKVLAGYSLGKADLLRRAMGKKIRSEMDTQQEMFIKGALENGISQDKAKEIFALVEKFAGYGFNKAHAASYGVISYQTAYLKTHYAVYFLIAALNLDISDHDKIALFIDDARKNDIQITPLDINISQGYFTTDPNNKNGILLAFGSIKGVTSVFGNEIVLEREKNGNFTSVVDFVERIPAKSLNKKYLESLIKAGCFDSLHSNRMQLTQSIERLLAHSSSYHQDKASNQMSLLGSLSSDEILVKESDDMTYLEKSAQEFSVLGNFVRFHPVVFYEEVLKEHHIINSQDLKLLKNGSRQIKIAAVIQKKDSRMSARGRYITLQLSDPFGLFEASIFNEEIIKLYNDFLNVQQCAIFNCDIQKDEYSIRMNVASIESMKDFTKNKIHNLKLYLNEEDLPKVLNFLQNKISFDKVNAKIHILLTYNTFFLLNLALPNTFYLEMEDRSYLDKYELKA
jgi:DNA polymerase-3 subunit alpha